MNEKIMERIRDMSGSEQVKMEDRLAEDIGLDSMNMVLLLLEVENLLGVELREEDMNPNTLVCVGDVVALTQKYRKEAENT